MVARSRGPSAAVARERRRVVRALRSRAPPAGNEALRAYLGSPVPVLGVRIPDLRRVVRDTARRLASGPRSDASTLVRALWSGDLFEEKEVAIELLGRPPLNGTNSAWLLGRRWVDRATGWALSDSLASGSLAPMVAARPARFAELLEWTRSTNLWRRRASTYALRDWVRAGELDRPFELLERLLDDPERWVQRAVGTWLRECWKKDAARTERFLRREIHRLAPVTLTVATERTSKSFRDELRRRAARHRTERRAY
ncbi:MAG: DNA alkylation repair protein [Candidatus Lutacidiplasmatales archaeon]